jgi:integrase
VEQRVAASTQNQALSGVLFLYRDVLKIELPFIEGIEKARCKKKLPVVFTRLEALAVLNLLIGIYRLIASLLYGSGMRITECLRLRVKDIDFALHQITIRDGKGEKDRITMLPKSLSEQLQRHLEKVRLLHEEDLAEGFGDVFLPYALERKYPAAPRAWEWQYVFPFFETLDRSALRKRKKTSSVAGRSAASGPESHPESRNHEACQLPHISALCRVPDYAG